MLKYFNRFIKWVDDKTTLPWYIKPSTISEYKQYCTKCGTQFILLSNKDEGIFDPNTGIEYRTVVFGCPYNHIKIKYSTNPKYISYPD